MSYGMTTLSIVLLFVGIMVFISYQSAKNSQSSANSGTDGFIVGGRNIGTFVLLMSMGATYFSTWTLLGSFGSYYRSGVWFMGFTVWTIFHAFFIWFFGTRIWLTGKVFNFVTPGQMIEHYYRSSTLRFLFALVGIAALIPYMLIQVTGGARALEGLTDGAIPYVVGVTITTVIVGFIVLWAGFRGTAWTDTFMGIFFGSILFFVLVFVIGKAGGWDVFHNVAQTHPEKLVNSGSTLQMMELWLGLGFGSWVLPHMWQKFYSARSAQVLGKVAALTPLWNSWMMACIPLFVGIAANVQGLIPGVDENSDALLPLFFSEYAPIAGTFVVAGILAAAISTINSQLLSSASLVAEDICNKIPSIRRLNIKETNINRFVVLILTGLIFYLAMSPGGSGLIVPIAALGFGLGLQLVPAALGALYWKFITASGAIAGLVTGTIALAAVAIFEPSAFPGPGITGLIVNSFVTLAVSLVTKKVPEESIENYHNLYRKYMGSEKDNKA
ncbi:sodium:solute symporter family protein [Kushneria sp. Sum13]|uniref:sodium:solute symporter family protein n=1 Tax=Kushneria sp. Sum13 TaxID=3459196 RepID=UPI00404686D9